MSAQTNHRRPRPDLVPTSSRSRVLGTSSLVPTSTRDEDEVTSSRSRRDEVDSRGKGAGSVLDHQRARPASHLVIPPHRCADKDLAR